VANRIVNAPDDSVRDTGELAMAVDDAAAGQVIDGQLDADAISRQDANPIAAHLPARVAQRPVTVLELDAKEAAA